MKKLIVIVIAMLIIPAAYMFGKYAGVRHAIENAQIYAIEHDEGFSTRVLIDFDGQVHVYEAN